MKVVHTHSPGAISCFSVRPRRKRDGHTSVRISVYIYHDAVVDILLLDMSRGGIELARLKLKILLHKKLW